MKPYIASIIVILCIIFAPAPSLRAQNSETAQVVSLHEAIDIALKNNSQYKIALHDLKIAKEKINETWGTLFPSLESEASMIKQYAEMGFMSLSQGQYDIKVVQLKFGINPGAFYNSLEASKKGYKASAEKARKIKNDVTFSVIKSYFRVILSQEMIDLRRSAIAFLEENLKDVENQYKTGSVPKYDLLQARVKLLSQEPYRIESENNSKVALDYFNYTLGMDRIQYTADRDTLNRPANPLSEKNDDERIASLTDQAMKNRPEILLLQIKKDAAQDKQDIYKSMYIWPVFTFGGYYGLNKNFLKEGLSPLFSTVTGDESWQQNWQIRIAATYRWGSLFPVDTNKVKERQEELSVKKAEMELHQLKRGISISIKSSYYGLLSSYKKIISQKENVEAAEEGLRIAKVSYKAGVIKNADLLAAQFSLTKAKTGYINAVNSYYLSLAKLQKETGIEDEQSIIQGE